MSELCDEGTLTAVIEAMNTDPESQIPHLETLLSEFPADARLHFLYGSVLIGAGRLIDAHRSLSRAVEIAPDFPIARFQLGLFQLTSGEPANALETFGRLDSLPDGHYLRKFVDGLRCLIRDDFRGAVDNLRRGIELNEENPPLSQDMRTIVDRCMPLIGSTANDAADGSVSETSLILQQSAERRTMN